MTKQNTPAAGDCQTKCWGGAVCVCDPKRPHRVHVCRNEGCICKGMGLVKTLDRNGDEVYKPAVQA